MRDFLALIALGTVVLSIWLMATGHKEDGIILLGSIMPIEFLFMKKGGF